jgi:hypothetical protein
MEKTKNSRHVRVKNKKKEQVDFYLPALALLFFYEHWPSCSSNGKDNSDTFSV